MKWLNSARPRDTARVSPPLRMRMLWTFLPPLEDVREYPGVELVASVAVLSSPPTSAAAQAPTRRCLCRSKETHAVGETILLFQASRTAHLFDRLRRDRPEITDARSASLPFLKLRTRRSWKGRTVRVPGILRPSAGCRPNRSLSFQKLPPSTPAKASPACAPLTSFLGSMLCANTSACRAALSAFPPLFTQVR